MHEFHRKSHRMTVWRRLVERAYLIDPLATERDLAQLDLDEWIAELRIDHQAGRLAGNVAASAAGAGNHLREVGGCAGSS